MIVRLIKDGEREKVARLLKRCGSWRVTEGLLVGMQTYIGLVDHKIVATMSVVDNNRLCFLGVSPRYRRKGNGRTILQKVCKTLDLPYLYVRMYNWRAIRLYLSEGFRVVGTRDLSFKMRRQYVEPAH